MNIVFFGTPEIAIATLINLKKDKDINIKAVITQVDKAQGRKQLLSPPPIKIEAEKLGIKIIQVKSNKEIFENIKDMDIDFFVVIAFGMILNEKTLNLPKIAPINIHASILPKYRGASPIQSALLNGDKETGVTIMRMVKEMDKGPIYKIEKIKIEKNDTYDSLSEKLGQKAGEIISSTLKSIKSGQLKETIQNEKESTYCTMIKKEEGEIMKNENIENIYNKYRAFKKWPEIYIKTKNNIKIKLLEIKTSESIFNIDGFKYEDKKLYLSRNKKSLEILKLQIEGKKPIDPISFYNGYKSLID